MARVLDFVQDQATCTMAFGDDKATLTYIPSKMTAAGTERLKRYIDEQDALAFARHFCDIVVAWDLEGPLYGEEPLRDDRGDVEYDDDGNEITERKLIVENGALIPLKPHIVKFVPQSVLNHLWQELNNDMSPDPQRGRGSRRR